MELSHAIEGFMIAGDNYSPTTLEIYQWAYSLMLRFLGDKPVEAITEEDLHRFFAWLKADYKPTRMNGNTAPLTGRSLENVWTAMRSFFRFCTSDLHLEKRPDLAIKRPQYKPRIVEPLTENQIRKMLDCAERTRIARTTERETYTMRRRTGARDRALVLFLLDTGMRASECARTKVEDIDLKVGQVLVQPFGTGRKTKNRITYLGNAARKALWKYWNQRPDIRQSDPCFLTRDDRPMDRGSIRLIVNELGDRAGIAHAHPHRIRHTFCYNYIKNGGDPFTLSKIAGFSLEMAMTYVHMVDADAKARHAIASPGDNWRL